MRKYTILFLTLFCLGGYTHASGEYSISKGVKKVRLNNGTTVLINENHSQPLVSVQVWVKVGSVNEDDTTAGLSHFIEHLIFKGSRNFPGDAMTRMVETRGGMINAGTSKEYTQYYIDIQKDGFEDSVRALADAMSEALFPEDEINRERPVVVEEIIRSNDNPGSVLFDLFNRTMFLKTAYRQNIIGLEQVIRNTSREDIIKYYKKHYIPENMIVSVGGDFKKNDALKVIKDTFGRIPKSESIPVQPDLIEPEHKPNFLAKTKEVEHAYWLAGFPGPDINSDDQFAADLTSMILGTGRSSRLYRKLREEERLVYYIHASFWSQRGTGMFAINSIFEPKNEKKAVDAIYNELNKLRDEGPTDAELNRVKVMSRSQWFFGLETIHDRASTLGYWHLLGRPELADTYIEKLNKVTKKDISDFLNKYYGKHSLNQAVLIPKDKNAK